VLPIHISLRRNVTVDIIKAVGLACSAPVVKSRFVSCLGWCFGQSAITLYDATLYTAT